MNFFSYRGRNPQHDLKNINYLEHDEPSPALGLPFYMQVRGCDAQGPEPKNENRSRGRVGGPSCHQCNTGSRQSQQRRRWCRVPYSTTAIPLRLRIGARPAVEVCQIVRYARNRAERGLFEESRDRAGEVSRRYFSRSASQACELNYSRFVAAAASHWSPKGEVGELICCVQFHPLLDRLGEERHAAIPGRVQLPNVDDFAICW